MQNLKNLLQYVFFKKIISLPYSRAQERWKKRRKKEDENESHKFTCQAIETKYDKMQKIEQ